MTTLTIIMTSWFFGYVAWIKSRFGVLSSISASSYALTGNRRYIFTLWLFVLGVMNLFQNLDWWGGLMAMGFAIAGITIEHGRSKDLEDEWHAFGTVIAIVAGFVGLHVLYGIWVPAVAMALGTGLLYLYADNWIWWAENWAAAMLTLGLLVR